MVKLLWNYDATKLHTIHAGNSIEPWHYNKLGLCKLRITSTLQTYNENWKKKNKNSCLIYTYGYSRFQQWPACKVRRGSACSHCSCYRARSSPFQHTPQIPPATGVKLSGHVYERFAYNIRLNYLTS